MNNIPTEFYIYQMKSKDVISEIEKKSRKQDIFNKVLFAIVATGSVLYMRSHFYYLSGQQDHQWDTKIKRKDTKISRRDTGISFKSEDTYVAQGQSI